MKKDDIYIYNSDFIQEIKRIVTQARQKAYTAINSAMVEAYWQMGKRIVEQEQQGKDRADYGSQLLKSLSKELTAEFGKGFSVGSLYYYRQFYQTFPEIFATPWRILTWSHYKRLLQVANADARTWYLKEAAEQMWSALAFEIQRGFRCSAVGVGHRSFHFLPCLAVHEYGSFVFPQSGRCVVLVLIVVASRESQHYGRESE